MDKPPDKLALCASKNRCSYKSNMAAVFEF